MNNQTLGLTVTRIALGVILFAHGYLLKIGTLLKNTYKVQTQMEHMIKIINSMDYPWI